MGWRGRERIQKRKRGRDKWKGYGGRVGGKENDRLPKIGPAVTDSLFLVKWKQIDLLHIDISALYSPPAPRNAPVCMKLHVSFSL